MRSISLAVALSAVGLVALSGCAHTTEVRESSGTVVAVPQTEAAATREVIAVDEQAPQEEVPRARPRLTQTITLGQSNPEYSYSAPPPSAQQAQGGSTQNVIVNNNVIVNQPPAVYGGYGYGGYGYGGYGYSGRGGYGVRTDVGGRGGRTGTATWGSTGWEGAQGRPAAAGATPSVGGNWASAPSYGPRQMK